MCSTFRRRWGGEILKSWIGHQWVWPVALAIVVAGLAATILPTRPSISSEDSTLTVPRESLELGEMWMTRNLELTVPLTNNSDF